MWYHAKLPFSLEAIPLYSDLLVRILANIKGKSRKCLILDLDNTLWGGEIGDDGIGGIRLGMDVLRVKLLPQFKKWLFPQ